MSSELGDSEKSILLEAARGAIESGVEGRAMPEPPAGAPPVFSEKRGVFVSLHKGGALRGCIGFTRPFKGLYDAVVSAARSSAFEDPRFAPVSGDEAAELDIEISVLTPPEPVASWEKIEIGRHGVIIRKGGRQALYLPQQGRGGEKAGFDICRRGVFCGERPVFYPAPR